MTGRASNPRLRRVLVGANIFVALCLIAGAAGYAYVTYRNDQVRRIGVAGLSGEKGDQPINILLVGDNCRNCLNGSQANAFGTGSQVGGGRSDVTMVLHLDPKTHAARLLSIPRDLFLPIPGSAKANRIDANLNQGPQALVSAVQADLGIPITHFVELNFDSFQGVVNALGGIEMYFPVPLRDAYSALNITHSGCQSLNGFQALAVVRARHLYYEQNGKWLYDPSGDLGRIARDHEFLRILAAGVLNKGISNPLTANSIISTIAPQLQVDSGFSLSKMLTFVRQFRHVDPNAVPTYTLPVVVDPNSYYYRGADYGDVIFPTQPQDQQVIAKFLGSSGATANVAPSGISVQVVNGTGLPQQAELVSQGLGTLGFHATVAGNVSPVGSPAETTVYYPPNQLDSALRVQQDLIGLVTVGPNPPSGASGSAIFSPSAVTVVTGTGLGVATAAPSGSSPTTAPPVSANQGPPTPSQSPLASYDPTACPARAH